MKSQYKVVVLPNPIIQDLKCNGGWLAPEEDGNYVFMHCNEQKNGNYVAVGFCPVLLPKQFIVRVEKLEDGNVVL